MKKNELKLEHVGFETEYVPCFLYTNKTLPNGDIEEKQVIRKARIVSIEDGQIEVELMHPKTIVYALYEDEFGKTIKKVHNVIEYPID